MALSNTKPHRLVARRVAAAHSARRWTSRILSSPVLRWRHGAPLPVRLVFEPTDFRRGDPGNAAALAAGALLLGGQIADLTGPEPFDHPRLTPSARVELFSFGWLRDLKAAGSVTAQADACRLVRAWSARSRRAPPAHCPQTVDASGRRMIAWLTTFDFLVAGAEDDIHDVLLESLAEQRINLAAHCRGAELPDARLTARIAMVLYDAVAEGRAVELAQSLRTLKAELVRHIGPDGDPATRCGSALVEVAHDLVTLQHTLIGTGRNADADLRRLIEQAALMLRHRCLGSGRLARLHVAGAVAPTALSTAIDQAGARAATEAEAAAVRGGFARLVRGGTVIVMDVGPAPPLEHATRASASCLALEMSDGTTRLLGSALPVESRIVAATWNGTATRATAAHATLVLGDTSSGAAVELGPPGTALALAGPRRIRLYSVPEATGPAVIDAAHDGYREAFGMEHRRAVTLSETGDLVTGRDQLVPPRSAWAAESLPFAIYFHIDPGVEVIALPAEGAVELACVGGRWRLSVTEGATLSVERGPGYDRELWPAVVAVLRGRTQGATLVGWRIERIAALDRTPPVGNVSAAIATDETGS